MAWVERLMVEARGLLTELQSVVTGAQCLVVFFFSGVVVVLVVLLVVVLVGVKVLYY
jgi:hypothetical protein